ncbi:MAG: protein kinase [Candidatus Eisenbacteria bacterium]|nr:protein kinase [Candidatus Eisenbacteria bacterium]
MTDDYINDLERRLEKALKKRYGTLHYHAHGGMGVIFKARDPILDRDVAIKALKSDDAAATSGLKRFLQEARAAGRLSHPNIITVFDAQVDERHKVAWMVQEFVVGKNLGQRIAESPLSLFEGLDIAVKMFAGLARAHREGICHRDVKPANVLLGPESRVILTDFGIAVVAGVERITKDLRMIGTPEYMSPEHIRGEDLTPRADLYSFGHVLYEMLAGAPLFAHRDHQVVIFRQLQFTPVIPESVRKRMPAELARLILDLLQKDPARRPATQDVTDRLHALHEAAIGGSRREVGQSSRFTEESRSERQALGDGRSERPAPQTPHGERGISPWGRDAARRSADPLLSRVGSAFRRDRVLLFVGGLLVLAALVGGAVRLGVLDSGSSGRVVNRPPPKESLSGPADTLNGPQSARRGPVVERNEYNSGLGTAGTPGAGGDTLVADRTERPEPTPGSGQDQSYALQVPEEQDREVPFRIKVEARGPAQEEFESCRMFVGKSEEEHGWPFDKLFYGRPGEQIPVGFTSERGFTIEPSKTVITVPDSGGVVRIPLQLR